MMSIIKKKFVGDTLIYSLQPIISKLLTFVLIPLYTSFLSPADYGNLQYIMLFGAFMRGLSQMGLNSAFWKFRSAEGANKKQIALNLTLNQFAIGIFLLIFYLLIAVVFTDFNTVVLFIAVYYGALVVKTFSENILLFSRANFQAKKYLKIALIQTALVFTLNVVFVKYLELNFQGIVYSYLISFGIVALLFYRSLLNEFEGKYNWKLSRQMMTYGLPIMVGNIGLMILSLSDRWFIKYFNTDDELGLYAYGYKFADLMLVFVVQLFNMAFIPVAWKLKESAKAQETFSAVRNLIYFLFPFVAFMSIGVILLLAKLMTQNGDYMAGLDIVCMIALSHVFYGLYLFHSLGLQFAGTTKTILVCNLIAVALNMGLNAFLIPDYGAVGASLATIVSYFVMLVITVVLSQRAYPLQVNFFKTALHFIAIGGGVFGLSYFFLEIATTIWEKSLVAFGAAIVIGGILWLTSGLNKNTFKALNRLGE